MIHTVYDNNFIHYDGTQMQSLWAYKKYGVLGDSIAAFVGSCDVPLEHMIDQEDKNVNAVIKSPTMLHFIIEHFGSTLEAAVLRQRLFASQVHVVVQEALRARPLPVFATRSGDDIYIHDGEQKRKLSISIATVSPVSTKIHFAMNVKNADAQAGLKTAALLDYICDSEEEVKTLATQLLNWYKNEMETVYQATCKVNWVK